MSLLRAVVIDDERLARRELCGLLTAHGETITVVGEAGSADDALALIGHVRPDVLFLDVQLCPGTGFDLIERLERPVRVVFVTAFDAFALRAFEVNALDYLLKPINPQRLAQAIERLARGIDAPPAATRATAVTPPALTLDDRLFVEAHGRSRFLPVSHVVCITAEGDYSQIQTAEGERWLVLKSLREWERRLPAQHFARIHRSMIVNLACVDRLESAFNRGYLVHLRGLAAPVAMSRRRAAILKTRFG